MSTGKLWNGIDRESCRRVLMAMRIALIPLLICSLGAPLIAQNRFDANARTRSSDAGSWSANNWQGSGFFDALNAQGKWSLGVQGTNTDTGFLVQNVARNSAAAAARIQTGDRILSIAGFQVGYVGQRLYDLEEELNRHASAGGAVLMLVQDHLSGTLASINVQLQSDRERLSGSLVYRGRQALPADAIISVVIENMTRPQYEVRRGQVSFPLGNVARSNSGQVIPFEIAYDPAYINPQDSYRVRAWVSSNNRTILHSSVAKEVITRGNPSQTQLDLVSANSLVSTGNSNGTTAGYPNYNALDAEVARIYQSYLGRQPSFGELAAIRVGRFGQQELDYLPVTLMAGQEYYDLTGNNDYVWLKDVFQRIVGKSPNDAEVNAWQRRFAQLNYSRTELLKQLYNQVNKR